MKKYLLFLLIPIAGYSQTLDPSFHGDGLQIHVGSDTPSAQFAYDAALQSDGKMVYVGRLNSPSLNSFVARYNADGSQDNSFNQYGFKIINFPLALQTLAIQSDGKLLLAGMQTVLRISSNGNYDTSFNTNGTQTITLANNPLNIKCISVQPDNKIIVSGYIMNASSNDFAVARLNSDGTLDTTFDTDGITTIAIGSGKDEAFSHKIQSDGKIVVFGQSFNGTDYDFAIARIGTNGALDASFGTGGKVITSFAAGNDYGRSGEILSDGTILLLGSSSGKFAFAKYLSTGALDTSFSGDGKLLLNDNISFTTNTNPSDMHFMPRLKVLSGGKILISGSSDGDLKTIKLLANGNYDTTFDSDGIVIVNNDTDISTFLTVKPDGKIIAGGNSYATNLNDAKIKQIDMDANGYITANTPKDLYHSYDESCAGTIKLSDQSIVVVSSSFINYKRTLIVEKFLLDGFPDLDFGFIGHTYINNFSGASITKVVLLSDDSIIIRANNELYKITPAGELDTNFGDGGILDFYTLHNGELSYIDDFILTTDNKLLFACDYNTPNNLAVETAIVKLNLDGTIDNSFGTNGMIHYGFAGGSDYVEWPNTFYQDANGKILVASVSHLWNANGGSKMALSRLNPNGTFDTTFGNNGKYIYDHTSFLWTYNINISTENNYLINFSERLVPNPATYTLMLNYNGGVNTTFGNNGIANDASGAFNRDMVMLPFGKYLKAGWNNNQFSISRYNANGAIDNSFGVNGEINTTLGYSSSINNIALQADGKLLAFGNSFDGDQRLITLVRYTNVTLGTIDFSANQKTILVYPNPIENEATFEYTLSNDENITIDVVDLQGKIIKKIVTNEFQNTGKQTLHFDLNGVSAGNYILRIASAKGNQSVQILKK